MIGRCGDLLLGPRNRSGITSEEVCLKAIAVDIQAFGQRPQEEFPSAPCRRLVPGVPTRVTNGASDLSVAKRPCLFEYAEQTIIRAGDLQ